MEGEISELFVIAQALAVDIEFEFAPINKAERGYQLLQPQSYPIQKPKLLEWTSIPKSLTVGDGFIAIFSQLFAAWCANDKALRFTKKRTALLPLLEIIVRLQALLALIPLVLPRKATATLRAELQGLKDSLMQEEEDYLNILCSARYARLMLACGAFIVVRPWLEGQKKEAMQLWQQPLQQFVKTELEEGMLPFIELKKRAPKMEISNIADHQHAAQRLRIYSEWFLGLYQLEAAQVFFTVLCQIQSALQGLGPLSVEEDRVQLIQKLAELGRRFSALVQR